VHKEAEDAAAVHQRLKAKKKCFPRKNHQQCRKETNKVKKLQHGEIPLPAKNSSDDSISGFQFRYDIDTIF